MMIDVLRSATLWSDTEVIEHATRFAGNERDATARLIAALAELDERRLYLGQGCSSLFTYCVQVLHLSEHAAYGRIEAARVVRRFPAVLDLLAEGSVHLTAISLLAPHLTTENHAIVLAAARHKTKRGIEEIIATLRPLPPVPSTIRKMPAPAAASGNIPTPVVPVEPQSRQLAEPDNLDITAPPRQVKRVAEVKPLAPEHYKVQFTAPRETYDKLRLAQDLLRHTVPDGDVAVVIDRALTLLVQQLQKTKHAAVSAPRTARLSGARSRRYIPAAIRREVWRRDGGQCAFVGPAGRCTERGFVEYHHRTPFADGGATTVENLELRCRAHNAFEAERWFGFDVVRETAPPFSVGDSRFRTELICARAQSDRKRVHLAGRADEGERALFICESRAPA